MGRFLSGLSWSQPVASKARALGMGLDEVPTMGSASMRITFVPRWWNSVARLVAIVDFPVPPL